MNRVLKVVFSRAKGMFVVVSELGRACTKGSLKSVLIATPMVLASASVLAQGELVKNDASDDTKGTGIAIGLVGTADEEASATTESSIAIGVAASSSNLGSIAIGSFYNYVNPESSQVLTESAATSSGLHSIAIGSGATASGDNAFAIGATSTASETGSIALGLDSTSSGGSSVALGNQSNGLGDDSVALGHYSISNALMSVALGAYTQAYSDLSVALGALSVVQQDDILNGEELGVISVGNSSTINGIPPFTRRIINVADGVNDNDAVTVGQLENLTGITLDQSEWQTALGLEAASNYGIAFASQITSTDKAIATGVSRFDSIAIGRLAKAHSNSASNAIALGPNTRAYGSGAIAIGDSAIVASTDTNPQNTNIAQSAIAIGSYAKALNTSATTLGAHATASGINSVALGANSEASGNNVVSVGSSSLKRRIINVADGTIAENSKEAVTGGQLYTTNTNVATNTRNIADNVEAIANLEEYATNLNTTVSGHATTLGQHTTQLGEHATTLTDHEGRILSNTQALDMKADLNAGNLDGSNVASWSSKLGVGSVESGNTGLVTGGTVFSAIGEAKSYAKGYTDTQVTSLQSSMNTALNGKVNLALDNINDAGKAVIQNEAKSAINLEAGTGPVTVTQNQTNKGQWLIDLVMDSSVTENSTNLVTSGAVHTAVTAAESNAKTYAETKSSAALSDAKSYAKGYADTGLAAKADLNAGNLNDSNVASWSSKLGVGSVASGNTGLVTGGTVFSAIGEAKTAANAYTDTTTGAALTEAKSYAKDYADTGLAAKADLNAGNLNDSNVASWSAKLGIDTLSGSVTTNATNIANLTGVVDGHTTSIDNLLGASLTDEQKTAWLGKLGIDTLNNSVTTNTTNIAANKAATEANAAAIEANAGKIDANTAAINQNKTDIAANKAATEANAAAIEVNAGKIAVNEGKIAANEAAIQNNAGKIAANENAIQTNAGKIAVNEGKIAANETAIQTNAGKIAANESAIQTNAGKIAVNEGKIADNASAIQANTAMIGQNASNIQTLNQQINKTYDKVQRVGAGAAALAALRPQDFSADHPISGAVGLGHYDGKQAIAVGMFYRPTENLTVGFGASAAGNDDYMMNAGISYRFGGGGSYTAISQSDINRKVVDLTDQNRALIAQIESSNIREEASVKRLNQVSKQLASTQTALKSTQVELKTAQKKAELSDQKLDMVMKELAALREEIQKMKQK